MNNEIKAIKNTLGSIRDVQKHTDQALAEIRELGNRCNAEAAALYGRYKNDEISQAEYDTRMDAIVEYQRREGDRIERHHTDLNRQAAG